MRSTVTITYRIARRIVIGLIGGSVLLLGAIMIVTPGPAFVVIPAGLAILAMEFAWAKRWLHKIRERISSHSAAIRGKRTESRRRDAADS
jgi:tellurite resistance protein TerC